MAKVVRAATPEDVVLGCLLDNADLIFPSVLAEKIVADLRGAGMLRDVPAEDAAGS